VLLLLLLLLLARVAHHVVLFVRQQRRWGWRVVIPGIVNQRRRRRLEAIARAVEFFRQWRLVGLLLLVEILGRKLLPGIQRRLTTTAEHDLSCNGYVLARVFHLHRLPVDVYISLLFD
jgi:hypothetical protein